MKVNLKQLTTEQRNPHTFSLDQMSIRECLEIMNEEDCQVPLCVKKEIEHIEIAIQHIISALQRGGRLIYIGSGTSGRLGVLDAVECPPTFSTTYEVQGLIAGGETAFVKAQSGFSCSGGFSAINPPKEFGTKSDSHFPIKASCVCIRHIARRPILTFTSSSKGKSRQVTPSCSNANICSNFVPSSMMPD